MAEPRPTTPSLPVAEPTHRLAPGSALIIGTLLVSAFVVILNETAMNVAISSLVDDPALAIDERAAQWLTTAFMLTMAVVIPTTGWLMARFPLRTLYIAAMGAFLVGTLLAGFAPSFAVLLIGRVVQASGTAVILPLLMTTVMRLVPPERRGAFMGTVSMVISVAPALGPTVSGAILQVATWHWVFLAVAPLALAMLIVGARSLKATPVESAPTLDIVSIPLSAFGFGGLVYGLSLIGAEGTPAWQLPASLGVGVVALTAFIVRQRRLERTDNALLDFRTFRSPQFSVAVVVTTLAMASMFGSLIALPLVLQQAMRLEPLQVGLITLPGSLLMGLLSPVVGRLYDRVGPRPVVIPGALIVLSALVLFSQLRLDTPVWAIVMVQIVMSVGFALAISPIMTVALGALPAKLYGHGSAMVGTVQQAGGAAGTAAFVTIMATQQSTLVAGGAESGPALLEGARLAFLCAAALWVVGVLATFLLRKPESGDEAAPHEKDPVAAAPHEIGA